MKKQLKTIPEFANEQEERRFWEEHDSSEFVDWSKARQVVLPNLKPTTKTISLRLPQHLLDSILMLRFSSSASSSCLITVTLQL